MDDKSWNGKKREGGRNTLRKKWSRRSRRQNICGYGRGLGPRVRSSPAFSALHVFLFFLSCLRLLFLFLTHPVSFCPLRSFHSSFSNKALSSCSSAISPSIGISSLSRRLPSVSIRQRPQFPSTLLPRFRVHCGNRGNRPHRTLVCSLITPRISFVPRSSRLTTISSIATVAR